MIKVLSGFNGPGGSTVALNNLVNLFNASGMEATLYTNTNPWEGVTCRWSDLKYLNLKEEDVVVYHFMPLGGDRPKVKKLILSCHETSIFPIKGRGLMYDDVHFVSEFQKEWQGVEGTVIPNIVTKYSSMGKEGRVAGIIGSIDPNKRVELSIQRALDDGHDDIRLYGAITDGAYFTAKVLPLLGEKVSYRGIASDMQAVYDVLTDVYHSPMIETYNLIKPECKHAAVNYHGEEGNDTKAEYWEDERILGAWKKLLSS